MLIYLVVILLSIGTVTSSTVLDPLSDEFIDYINANQTLWKAGRNFHRDRPLIYFKRLMGSLRDINIEYLPRKTYVGNVRLPRNFDGRLKWRKCPTLRQIRDQGSCGCCWAVSAVSAMTDRFCIQSNGTKHFYFSEDDVLSCCTDCGSGCDFGILSKAWNYVRTQGTVSGGTFHSHYGCRPFEIPPCEHGIPGYRPQCGHVKKPMCNRVCQESYNKNYMDDKKKIGRIYAIKNEWSMRRDIFKYGPITTSFIAYEDFIHYKSGIYRHVGGKNLGLHSIKLVGWGKQNNISYWLAANSFNTDWGENGFFKIVRGENHCQIEQHAVVANILPIY